MVASKSGSDDLKPDISGEDLKRLYARASTQRFTEVPTYPQNSYAGVMPMAIKGRFANERERLGPEFDETQRQWRIKWIRDQKLHPNEPFNVNAVYYEYQNPIRRFYRWPLNQLESWLRSRTDKHTAITSRKLLATAGLGYLFMLWTWYYLKYNREHWEKIQGNRITASKEAIFPGDPRFPRESPKSLPHHFYDRGFSDRKVFLDTTNRN